MYQIGDKIVYPMHGAGVVEAIEEREIMGAKQKYYIMKMPIGDMKVMIPMANADEIGVRATISSEQATMVLETFRTCKTDYSSNWNKRYRENMLKIKSGDIIEVCSVVKILMLRDKSKGLSTGERKMLANAKQILISELVLANNAPKADVEETINSIIQEEYEKSIG